MTFARQVSTLSDGTLGECRAASTFVDSRQVMSVCPPDPAQTMRMLWLNRDECSFLNEETVICGSTLPFSGIKPSRRLYQSSKMFPLPWFLVSSVVYRR